ncbi:MAG: hypothetical protein ACOH5I_25515 [Oligoflexus sp.]
MRWKENNWIKFLEGYCKGNGQIQDEYVRKIASALRLDEPLEIKFPWQEEILQKFKDPNNLQVIILTGTAGDGKTRLCREIYQEVCGTSFSEESWNSKSYFSNELSTIVKDFSELKDEKSKVIGELIEVLKNGFATKQILIAVNDGVFIEALDSYIDDANLADHKKEAKLLKEIVEDKINIGISNCEKQGLINLINLSKLDAKENFKLIFKAILDNSGWNQCKDCIGSIENSCPIYSKYQIFKSRAETIENLANIILLLQLNNQHFTIRELLNLVSNTLVSSIPKSKKYRITDFEHSNSIFTCKTISTINEINKANIESSIEVGFWGLNLGPQKSLSKRPYSEINKLRFGDTSSNYWDSQISKPEERHFTIPIDEFLRGSEKSAIYSESSKTWMPTLRRSRMQLYAFCKDNDEKLFHLQKYPSYGIYKEKIYNQLTAKKMCSDLKVKTSIILALNRAFHGRFISDKAGELFIPEKGQGSLVSTTVFHGEEIREKYITIETLGNDFSLSGARIEPIVKIFVDKQEVKVSLTVEVFDYLDQVSKGAPPNTADPRIYKKLCILRSKLASMIRPNRRIETYKISNGQFKIVPMEF